MQYPPLRSDVEAMYVIGEKLPGLLGAYAEIFRNHLSPWS
jgi:hypothetical protein